MNLIYKMESQYKLKYPYFLGDLLRIQDTLCLCLKIYLSMHNVSIQKKELISLIKQVKTEMKKSPKKKLDILRNTNSQNATSKELQLVSSCLMKYTNSYNNKKGRKIS